MKIHSFSLIISLALTLLTVGIVTTIIIPMQTAEADRDCRETNDGDLSCSGGRSEVGSPGGFGGHTEYRSDGYTTAGGSGGPGGGGGFRCESAGSGNDCVGKGFNSGSGDDD